VVNSGNQQDEFVTSGTRVLALKANDRTDTFSDQCDDPIAAAVSE
jgi:hypothetical protein